MPVDSDTTSIHSADTTSQDDDFIVWESDEAFGSQLYQPSTGCESSLGSSSTALGSSLPLCYCKTEEYLESVIFSLERFLRMLRNAPEHLSCGKQNWKENSSSRTQRAVHPEVGDRCPGYEDVEGIPTDSDGCHRGRKRKREVR